MTWNIRSLRDDRNVLVSCIRQFAPDVLFVQEAPRFLRGRSKLAALARETGLVVASGGYPAAEVALLTHLRVDVSDSAQLALSRTSGLHRRGVALAHLATPRLRFAAACVHLGVDSAERMRHAAEIKDQLDSQDWVVAGDFNEPHSGRAWQLLQSGLADAGAAGDAATYPAWAPNSRIDGLLVPPSWRTRSVSPTEIIGATLLAEATDHLPVVADVVD